MNRHLLRLGGVAAYAFGVGLVTATGLLASQWLMILFASVVTLVLVAVRQTYGRLVAAVWPPLWLAVGMLLGTFVPFEERMVEFVFFGTVMIAVLAISASFPPDRPR